MLKSIISELRAKNPQIVLLIAQIIPHNKSGEEAIEPFNNAIPAMIAEINTAISPVILVDQYTGFNSSTDLRDGEHPNVSGENKMAQKWFEALQEIL